jgi:hypothetical protein
MRHCCLTLALLAAPVAAFAQTKDHAPSALPSSSHLRQDRSKSESWTYAKPGLKLGAYRSVMILPTIVYSGPDAQFDGVDSADRQKYARIVTEALRSELGKSYEIVSAPKADTLRMRVTLLGADTTKGGLATATRVTPLGLASSAVRSIRGKEGRFTGSLLLALELHDGRSNVLQFAAVRRRSPNALDIPATLSTTETVKAVAQSLAKDIRERLEQAPGRAR